MIQFGNSKDATKESWTTISTSLEVGRAGGTSAGATIIMNYGKGSPIYQQNPIGARTPLERIREMRKAKAERDERNKTALRKGRRKYADLE